MNILEKHIKKAYEEGYRTGYDDGYDDYEKGIAFENESIEEQLEASWECSDSSVQRKIDVTVNII